MRFFKAINRFFGEILRSCYDLDWYRGVRSRPWTQSFAYLVKFCLLIAFVTGLVAGPTLFIASRDLRGHLERNIPDGAVFEISKGVFSTNVGTPLDLGEPKFPIIIDPAVEGLEMPADALRANGLLIGKNTLFVRQSKAEQRLYALAEMPDGKISKEDLVGAVRGFGPPVAALISVIVALFYFFFMLSSSFSTAIMFGAAAFLAAKIAGVSLTYKQWLAFGCTAVTLPTLVGMGLAVIGIVIPFAYSFIFFAFAIAVIVDEKSRQIPIPPAPQP
ncbi:DUF1189 family protein [Candidatus Uhrbacteria bacterium]|nr:DUF1189 family protein [Candidatus Uhrbacteria bacterium]